MFLSLHIPSSCQALCWPAVCVIGPCSHLKQEWWVCSKVQRYCIICFSTQLFFFFYTFSKTPELFPFIWHMVQLKLDSESVPNEQQWSTESAEFYFILYISFASAAESGWGECVSEASAAAGYCPCGSVPHAPHWWVSCNGCCSSPYVYIACISFALFFPPLIDYLNNLSPDSKEYEDTQGTVNQQQHLCGRRLPALSVTGEPYCPVFVALCLWGIYLLSFDMEREPRESQFRPFCLGF